MNEEKEKIESGGVAAKKKNPFVEFWKGVWESIRRKCSVELLMYILKRLLLMVFTFIIIFILCFVLVRLLPVNADVGIKDPDAYWNQLVIMGRYYQGDDGEYYPLPIITQFWNFLVRLFAGEGFGYSWTILWLATPEEILASKLTPTVIMNIYSMLISVPLGIGLGIYMALKKNKWQDNVLSVLVMLVISVPSFIYAFFLQYTFGYLWNILPPLAATDVNYFSWDYTKSIILPVLSLSFGSIAGYSRYTRAELTEVLTSDFMLLARTKGLTRGQATVRHALRNSMVPIFPMILGEIISVLSGSMIIENIFQVDGVGGLYLESITRQDYDVFQYVSMFYVIIGLLGTLIIDISYGIVDPRIRMGGGKQ